MKKLLSLILVLAMCLSLCACGGSSETEATSAATEAPATESVATTEAPTETTEPEPEFITETTHCTMEGIYVDNSYVDEENASLKMVYVLYTAFTNDQSIKVCTKSSTILFETGNSYTSDNYSQPIEDYMPNYYSSSYIKELFIGNSQKVLCAFKIPEAEFTASEVITIRPYGLPSGEELTFPTADVKFFDSADALAQEADPEGYAQISLLHEPADEETVSKVSNAINGYYWSFYVNNMLYEIEFYSPDEFELRVNAYNIRNGGEYEVLKGYILCTYSNSGLTVEIPWTETEEGEIDIDTIAAFDVNE